MLWSNIHIANSQIWEKRKIWIECVVCRMCLWEKFHNSFTINDNGIPIYSSIIYDCAFEEEKKRHFEIEPNRNRNDTLHRRIKKQQQISLHTHTRSQCNTNRVAVAEWWMQLLRNVTQSLNMTNMHRWAYTKISSILKSRLPSSRMMRKGNGSIYLIVCIFYR